MNVTDECGSTSHEGGETIKVGEPLPPPDEEEEDMLDLAWGLEDTSRLCCQIKVSPQLKDATFVIPEDPDI
mgnify:CR=1 FL=1